jgi:hypothetical protein
MKINRIKQQLEAYQIQCTRDVNQLQAARRESAKMIDANRATATRVARNIQLGLDKGRNIDIDC